MSQTPPPSRSSTPAPSRSETPPPPRKTPLTPLEHAIAESEGNSEDVTLAALFARNLTRALMVGIIPATVVLALGTGAWIMSGVPPIRAAASATYTAEHDYHAALKQSQRLLTELAAVGTPVGALEPAWFAFAEAPQAERAEAADRFMLVLIDEVKEARVVRGEESSHLVVLLTDATRARRRASVAWHDWTDRTSSMRGRTAVLLGLAKMPHPDLARYEQPLPEGRDLPMK